MASKFAILALLGGAHAATYSADLGAEACLASTSPADETVFSGQYCLDAGSFTKGSCCDTSAAVPGEGSCAVAPQSDGAAYTSEVALCGSKSTLSNRLLRQFLEPSNTQYCPTEYKVFDITETQTTQSHIFSTQVPTAAAASWHCKYGLKTTTKVPDGTASESRGYYYFLAESYGFDKNVVVIVQPRGKFLDFNWRSQTSNPDRMTKVFLSQYGRKYIIPAEYDIYIDFAPIKYSPEGQAPLAEGKFQFLAKWIPSTTDYENDDTVTIIKRLPPLEGSTPDGDDTAPVPEEEQDDQTPEEAAEPEDNTVLPVITKRESAIDETIADKWNSWKGQEAFYGITNEEVAVGSTALIIIIVGIVCICCFVSYLERKKIAEEARRASAYAKRASQKIRRSIKSMRGQDPGPEEPEAPKTEKEIKKMAAENATNKNEKAFLNDMFTDQQKADAEAAAADAANENA